MKDYLIGFLLIAFHSLKAQFNEAPLHKDDAAFVSWANGVEIVPGPQQAGVDGSPPAAAGTTDFALGKAGDNPTVSLGDGGYAVLTFPYPLKNGTGPDFAVFENSFDGKFLELAFVEVSSDGINFFRFPAISNTDTIDGIGSFEFIEPENIYNLAGKFPIFNGTPFDLEELSGLPGLDILNITHVKVIDVTGSVNPDLCSRDSEGNIVADPWPTPFPACGFDLDAVGVIHNNDPAGLAGLPNPEVLIFPQPAALMLNLKIPGHTQTNGELSILTMSGKNLIKIQFTGDSAVIAVDDLSNGIYLLRIKSAGLLTHKKLVISR